MSRSLTWMHLWMNKRYVGKARQGLSGGGSGRNKATRGAYEEEGDDEIRKKRLGD
jgi:hypothetical protein